MAHIRNLPHFLLCIQGSIFCRMRNIYHARKYHMFIISICIIILNILFQYRSLNLTILLRNLQHFISRILDCPCLVYADMTCISSHHAFVILQHRSNHHRIGLCTAHKKLNFSFRTLTRLLNFFFGACTIDIISITRKAFQIRFCQTFQNLWMRSCNIITFKR